MEEEEFEMESVETAVAFCLTEEATTVVGGFEGADGVGADLRASAQVRDFGASEEESKVCLFGWVCCG